MMDKPIHTLKEWHKRAGGVLLTGFADILHDWGRDREILEASLNEYKDAECRAVKLHGEALVRIAELNDANTKRSLPEPPE